MRVRLPSLILLLSLSLPAQMKMSVNQLLGFVKSSLELKHDDKQLADYLRKVQLLQRLDDRTIEELQGQGAGPKTVAALLLLRDASANLPLPPKPVPKVVPPPIPPPSLADQRRILDETREYALSYVKRLPDFICTQVTRRFFDPSGLEFYQRADVVTARLSYFGQKEEKKVILVNNQLMDVEYERLGGTTSTGEFGSLLQEVFAKESDASFAWERWTTLRGKRHYVFSYRVAQPRSKWKILYDRAVETTPGYRGSVYVERDSGVVARITLIAEDIPSSFPVQMASTELDYDYTTISDKEFLLPLKAVIKMRSGKALVKNEIEFRMYRKFGADATITFDTPEPLPDDKTKEHPPKP